MPVSCAPWRIEMADDLFRDILDAHDDFRLSWRNMAHKSSQQRFKALSRGGQWLELTITLSSASAVLGRNPSGAWFSCVVQKRATFWGSYRWTSRGMAKVTAAFPMEQTGERFLGKYEAFSTISGQELILSTLSMQVIDGGAWVEQWKRFYRPFKLGKRLVIRPPWEPYTAAADELLLTLNPDRLLEPASMRRRNCASPP